MDIDDDGGWEAWLRHAGHRWRAERYLHEELLAASGWSPKWVGERPLLSAIVCLDLADADVSHFVSETSAP